MNECELVHKRELHLTKGLLHKGLAGEKRRLTFLLFTFFFLQSSAVGRLSQTG